MITLAGEMLSLYISYFFIANTTLCGITSVNIK